MCESLAGADPPAIRQAGQKLYHWVEAEARFSFRGHSHRFLNVGSYHILADEIRLGWHQNYAGLFIKPPEDVDGGT